MKSISIHVNGNISIAVGSLIWMAGGTVLTLRPGSNPPQAFRHTHDVMPFLGLAMLLIASGIASSIGNTKGRIAFAGKLLFGGALTYALGTIVRVLSLPGKWEPLMPLGFIASIIGLLLCGISFKAKNFASPALSYCLMAAAGLLLCFNDQYLPWIGIAFGAVMLTISLLSTRPE